MAKTATTTLTVNVQGDGLNYTDADTLSNTAAVAPTSVACSAGNNTVNVPTSLQSGTVRVKIKPPAGNATALTLKGVNGDTGISLTPSEPSFLSMPSGTSSFVINAGGSVTVELEWG